MRCGIVGGIAVLVAAVAVSAESEPFLFSGVAQKAPYTVRSVATGDFNEDGLPDLFVPGESDYYMSVFLGRGDGSFEERRIVANFPWPAAVGDFDGDGHQDLATGYDEHLSILLGNGDGTFGVPIDSPMGDTLTGIAVDDFNEDGRLDLIVTHFQGPYNDVLLGNGDGTFGAPYRNPFLVGPFDIGDVNRDGHLDLVMRGLTVQLGQGDGTFTCCVTSGGIGGATYELLVDDFDGNGALDAAAAVEVETDVYEIRIRYGDGTGQFFPGGLSLSVGESPAYPRYLSFADLDADGRGDLVSGGGWWFGDGHVSIFRGNSSGSFDPPVRVPTIDLTSGPVVVEDFDADGAPDLSVVSAGGETLGVLFGRGDGTFWTSDRRDHPFDGGEYAFDLVLEDLDLDGDLDAAALGISGLGVLLGDGAGDLVEQAVYPYDGENPWSMAVGRLDLDPWPDLVVLDATSPDLSLWLGQGAGTFVPGPRVSVGGAPYAVTVQDFDRDGLGDIAVSHGDPLNTVGILLNQGGGAFSASQFHSVGDAPRHLAAADLDGDGYMDLVTANYGSADVSVLRGGVGGSFAPETRIPVGAQPWEVAIADVDGKGSLDIIVAAQWGGAAVVPGNGAGGFGSAVPTDFGGHDALAADFDGDGRVDLGGWCGSLVCIALGRGDLTFAAEGTYGFREAYELFAGDVDGDGRPDLVAPSNTLQHVSSVAVLLNRGPKRLSFAADRATLAWPIDDDAVGYEVYRGAISALIFADEIGYGVCSGETDTAHNEWVDDVSPGPGAGFFYLVAAVDALGRRDLGATSAGAPRVPAEVCP